MQNKTGEFGVTSEWPVNGLESVPNCPVCGADDRKLLHEGLTDRIFFCAPGKWTMYRCESCASAYLNPRPSSETIGLAYQRYYTHNEMPSFTSLSLFGKLRRTISNGYRNYRYGTRDYPASIFGVVVVTFMKNGRAVIDAGMRHLPRINTKKRLLDLGCGSGLFLLRARSAGWDVIGADFDSKAVDVARGKGLDVRLGGLEKFDPFSEQFDVITLSHVIEHVPQPIEVLRDCYALLKPGGYVWIATPNIEAEGHSLFGSSWRGLEPPRHLVLFNLKSMCDSLNKVGFSDVEVQPYLPSCNYMFSASLEIKKGITPYTIMHKDIPFSLIRKTEKIAKENPKKREFVTVKAWKTYK